MTALSKSTASLAAYMRAGLRVLLVGPPGLGKTARIFAAAKAAGYDVHVMRAGLADRVDIGGALIPDAAAGVTRELPLESIAALRASSQPTLLFLDDLGQAPIDVQAACMRLFDTGYLSPSVLVWGATNRPQDKAGVAGLVEPLRSRFDMAFRIATPPSPDTTGKAEKLPRDGLLAPWSDELDGWCEWALTHDAPTHMVAWHRASQGRTLYDWRPDRDPAQRYADYRSWQSVMRLESAGLADRDTVAAAIGVPAAAEYLAFRALAGTVPTLADIEADPDGVPVPADASQLWLVATACGAALTAERAGWLVRYTLRMPKVYAALAMRDAYRREGSALARSPEWQAWFVNNQGLFS